MGSQVDKKLEELGLRTKATGNCRAAQTGKPFFVVYTEIWRPR
jgi:hypothetical protein